jgi:hypothetical protein
MVRLEKQKQYNIYNNIYIYYIYILYERTNPMKRFPGSGGVVARTRSPQPPIKAIARNMSHIWFDTVSFKCFVDCGSGGGWGGDKIPSACK